MVTGRNDDHIKRDAKNAVHSFTIQLKRPSMLKVNHLLHCITTSSSLSTFMPGFSTLSKANTEPFPEKRITIKQNVFSLLIVQLSFLLSTTYQTHSQYQDATRKPAPRLYEIHLLSWENIFIRIQPARSQSNEPKYVLSLSRELLLRQKRCKLLYIPLFSIASQSFLRLSTNISCLSACLSVCLSKLPTSLT